MQAQQKFAGELSWTAFGQRNQIYIPTNWGLGSMGIIHGSFISPVSCSGSAPCSKDVYFSRWSSWNPYHLTFVPCWHISPQAVH
jgi:hypothetical protein